jgi:hypothetical protein
VARRSTGCGVVPITERRCCSASGGGGRAASPRCDSGWRVSLASNPAMRCNLVGNTYLFEIVNSARTYSVRWTKRTRVLCAWCSIDTQFGVKVPIGGAVVSKLFRCKFKIADTSHFMGGLEFDMGDAATIMWVFSINLTVYLRDSHRQQIQVQTRSMVEFDQFRHPFTTVHFC